jgi:ADP-L-glycero-D-manno-heptose 6-epimerase
VQPVSSVVCLLKKLNDEGVFDVLVVDYLENGDKWKNLVGKRFTDIIHPNQFLEELQQGDYDNSHRNYRASGSYDRYNRTWTLTSSSPTTSIIPVTSLSMLLIMTSGSSMLQSAATYGLGENGYSDSMTYGLRPLNMYGLLKAALR